MLYKHDDQNTVILVVEGGVIHPVHIPDGIVVKIYDLDAKRCGVDFTEEFTGPIDEELDLSEEED